MPESEHEAKDSAWFLTQTSRRSRDSRKGAEGKGHLKSHQVCLMHGASISKVSANMLTDSGRLGEVEKTNRRVHSVQTAYPYGRTPLATYIFKYRSHRMCLLHLCHEEFPSGASSGVLIIEQEIFKSREFSPALRRQFRLRTGTHKISLLKKHVSPCAVCVGVKQPK